MFEKMAILGLGLLGGSLARASRNLGLVKSVSGSGRRDEALKFALESGIADSVSKSHAEAVKGADLVVICTPVGMIPDVIDAIAPSLEKGAIVTDVGSTKTRVVEHAEKALPDYVSFVGAHPMAGSEMSGIEHSNATLFENALCVLTSSTGTNISALNKMEIFWKTMRARVLIASPMEHDMLVAASSHLPHMAAVALALCVSDVSDKNEKVVPLLAGGFRDTTRVASGSPDMWLDICMENSGFIASMMDSFEKRARAVRDAIATGDRDALMDILRAAKTFRDEAPARGKGALEPVNELLVDVADRPGVIGEIATALGASGISIRNINVQHVREMRGGALALALEKKEDVPRAAELLREKGFSARELD